MRNFLDTARIAQSLDGERLMGCLHYPGRKILPDPFDYNTRHRGSVDDTPTLRWRGSSIGSRLTLSRRPLSKFFDHHVANLRLGQEDVGPQCNESGLLPRPLVLLYA